MGEDSDARGRVLYDPWWPPTAFLTAIGPGEWRMTLINDEPTLVDRLARSKLVGEVGHQVATCDPPQVFAVHGDWGMGKTSFLPPN